MEERYFGIVKTFDLFKGIGFIRREKGKDVFFFYEEIAGDNKILSIGDTVSFLIKNMPKGPRAYSITKESSAIE